MKNISKPKIFNITYLSKGMLIRNGMALCGAITINSRIAKLDGEYDYTNIPKVDYVMNLKTIMQICEKYIKDDKYVYKIIMSNSKRYLIVLEKLPNTKTNELRMNIANKKTAKFRGSIFKVECIIDTENPNLDVEITSIRNSRDTLYATGTWYTTGKNVEPDEYDEDIKLVCSNGIHFFKEPEVAYFYDFDPKKKKFSGVFTTYDENGQTLTKCEYIEGKVYEIIVDNLHDDAIRVNNVWDGNVQ